MKIINKLLHILITILLIWRIRINQINNLLFLWPLTIQQLSPTEKLETNILLSLSITITWTIITIQIRKTIIINIKKIHIPLTILFRIKITILIIRRLAKIQNRIIRRRNLITWTRIIKSSQFCILLFLLLIIRIINPKNKKNNRILYPLLITTLLIIRPRDFKIILLLTFIIIIPLEFHKLIFNIKNTINNLSNETN